MSEMTISIVLYGEFDKNNTNSWLTFYDYAKRLSKSLSFEPNYVGIIGEEFNSGKVLTVKRTEKRLLNSLEKGSLLSSLAVYSLPDDFTQAAFDYYFYLGRNGIEGNQNIILTFPRELYETLKTADIISDLKGFIQFENGQIFEMSRYECPMFYAANVNPPSTYQSLKIITPI